VRDDVLRNEQPARAQLRHYQLQEVEVAGPFRVEKDAVSTPSDDGAPRTRIRVLARLPLLRLARGRRNSSKYVLPDS
jgi:hypothetical protein